MRTLAQNFSYIQGSTHLVSITCTLPIHILLLFTGELAEAIRKNTDIHFGLYYSLLDFFHPLYLEDHDENNCTTQNYVNVSIAD